MSSVSYSSPQNFDSWLTAQKTSHSKNVNNFLHGLAGGKIENATGNGSVSLDASQLTNCEKKTFPKTELGKAIHNGIAAVAPNMNKREAAETAQILCSYIQDPKINFDSKADILKFLSLASDRGKTINNQKQELGVFGRWKANVERKQNGSQTQTLAAFLWEKKLSSSNVNNPEKENKKAVPDHTNILKTPSTVNTPVEQKETGASQVFFPDGQAAAGIPSARGRVRFGADNHGLNASLEQQR